MNWTSKEICESTRNFFSISAHIFAWLFDVVEKDFGLLEVFVQAYFLAHMKMCLWLLAEQFEDWSTKTGGDIQSVLLGVYFKMTAFLGVVFFSYKF